GSWLLLGSIPSRRTSGSLGLRVRLYFRGSERAGPLLPAIPSGDIPSRMRITVSRSYAPFNKTAEVLQRSVTAQRIVALTPEGIASADSEHTIAADVQTIPYALWLFASSSIGDIPLSPAWRMRYGALVILSFVAYTALLFWRRYRFFVAYDWRKISHLSKSELRGWLDHRHDPIRTFWKFRG